MRKLLPYALAMLSVFLALPAFAQAAPSQGVLPQLLQSLNSPLVDAVCGVTLAVLGLFGRYAHNANQTTMLGRAAGIVTDYMTGAVKHLLEGLAPEIKADLANDGIIDAAERQHLLDKALLLLQAELPPWVQGVMQSSYGQGLVTMLKGKIASTLDTHIAALPGPTSPPVQVPEPKPTVP